MNKSSRFFNSGQDDLAHIDAVNLALFKEKYVKFKWMENSQCHRE